MRYDVTAMGELLIDFTPQGNSPRGMRLFEQNPGGAPANVACAVSRLGGSSAFIGKVGEDMHGRFLRETLRAEGVQDSGLVSDPEVFTTLAFVALDGTGERMFSFARRPGADTMLRPEQVRLELVEQARIFHFGSLSLTDEPSRSATLHALAHARSTGRIVSYDPNYRASLWPDVGTAEQGMRAVLGSVDVMKLSDEETALLTGERAPEAAARLLLEQGIGLVVVTLGKDGAYVCNREGGRLVPAVGGHRAVDTTGAGDAFWGAFLLRLARTGCRPKALGLEQAADCARFANAAAGICIEGYGAIPSMPDLQAVERRLAGSAVG